MKSKVFVFSVILSVIILLVSSLVILGCAKPAPAPALEPIKIGVMYPLTGPPAMVGKRMVDAATFAFEQAGWEVAGRKIKVIAADSGEPDPGATLDKAKKFVEFDKVSALIGPLMLQCSNAVGQYMSEVGVPHIISHPGLLTMSEFKWSFVTGYSNYQVSNPVGFYAAKEMGLKTVTAITLDRGDARAFEDAFKQGFEKAGGKVIQEQFTPSPCPDFAPYLTTLKNADAVAAWTDGTDAIGFLSQYHEMGIRARMPLVSIFFGNFFEMFILYQLPPAAADAMIGEKCATTYYTDLDTPVNKKFVADIKARFGYFPEEADAAAYTAAQVVLEALKATRGDTTPEKLKEAIIRVDFESPEGRLRIDPQTRFPIKDIYVVKIDKVGGGFTWTPLKTYKEVRPGGL